MEDETKHYEPDVVIIYDYNHPPHAELKIILMEALEKLGHNVLITEKSMTDDVKKEFGNDVAIIELKTVDEL